MIEDRKEEDIQQIHARYDDIGEQGFRVGQIKFQIHGDHCNDNHADHE